MADWQERLAAAKDTFGVFAPDADPQRVLDSMERTMCALGTFAFTNVGEMWSRPQQHCH